MRTSARRGWPLKASRCLLGAALIAGACFSTAATAERVPLGVNDAIERAVTTNLRTRLSQERIVEADAGVDAARSALNPRFSAEAGQYNRSVNLAAQGLSGADLPVPTRIGPFFSFESRLELLYRIYDAGRSWGIKGREIERHLAELQADIERKTVTVQAAGTYIQLLEALERVRISQSDFDLAERLVVQATNLETAGVAAGVDVTRAETRRAERRLQLTQELEGVRTTQRTLLRLTGLPLTDTLELEDNLLIIANPFPGIEETVTLGQEARIELQLASDQVALADSNIRQAEAGDDPSVDLVANGGLAGNTPTWNSTFVHSVGLSISWPIFDGGLTDAQVKAARSRSSQAQMQLDDTRIQVENEVRDAYSLLLTAQESLTTSEQAIVLANQELTMTQDRFAVGLTNNIEVVSSQDSLARARYSRLSALANYNIGLIRLASATGRPDLLLQAFQQAKLRKDQP